MRRRSSRCEWESVAKAQDQKFQPVVAAPPGMSCFHFIAHARHEHASMPAPRQQCILMLAGAGLSLTVGELYPAVRVYSLQGRGAEYLSFRWMIK